MSRSGVIGAAGYWRIMGLLEARPYRFCICSRCGGEDIGVERAVVGRTSSTLISVLVRIPLLVESHVKGNATH